MTKTTDRLEIKKPTLRTIADLSGFAVTTVSKALAGDPKIAEATRARVAQIAADVGYVPDRAAQRLRTGRTHVIALVLDPHSEILGFGASMISGIAAAVQGTRFHITLTQYQLDEDPLAPIANIVRNRLADGVIFARTEPQDARVKYLLEQKFPFVTHGRTDLPGHAWLDYDNDAFAFDAVTRLASLGSTRIGIIPPAPDYTFGRFLREGFWRGIKETGVEGAIPDDVDLNTDADALSARLCAWLSGPDRPDGIVCPGEISAMITHAAVCDAGLHPGCDVRLLAKQTSPVFDHFRPRIETIGEDIEAAGRDLAGLLLRQLNGEPASRLHKLLPPIAAD